MANFFVFILLLTSELSTNMMKCFTPEAKLGVAIDVHSGKQVTFDYSDNVPTSLVSQEQLRETPVSASEIGYAVVGAKIEESGSPGNVLIEGARALSSGVRHWRFIGVPGSEGNFGCGLSSTTVFGSGWKLNGFYLTSNGNIAGRGALKCGFVSNMPALPVVDWFIEVKGQILDIYLSVNGVPQGHAGHLEFPDEASVAAIRPMVTFDDDSKNCKVVFVDHETVAASSEAVYKKLTTAETPFDCAWRLRSPGFEAPEFGVILRMRQNNLSVKVVNNFSASGAVNSDGSITVHGPVIGTMMLAPEVFQPAERTMKQMLETARAWKLENQVLTLSSDVGDFTWGVNCEEPVSENPFLATF